MDFGIARKVAMIAAASKGIGFAAAKALAAEGCIVSICSRNLEDLDKALTELGGEHRGYICDVTLRHDLESWFSHTCSDLGMPSILVTNTGGPPAGGVLDLTDEQWQSGVQSTLMNVVRLVRLAAPAMREAKWGRIVHVTSLVAKEPAKLLPISSRIRTGLMSLTKLQAWELAPEGITVNSVLPGNTDTDRQRHLGEVRAEKERISFDDAMRKQSEGTAMKRFAHADEIGAPIAFLCSQQASYISGVSLLVDGATTCAFG